jgi:hypothetical protein
VCRVALSARYLRHSNVTIDVCRKHGAFFDRHEASAVLQSAEIAAVDAASTARRREPTRYVADSVSSALMILGGVAFALSLALPSFEYSFFGKATAPGFLCMVAAPFALAGENPIVGLLGLANVWLITLPMYLRRLDRFGVSLSALIGLVASAMAVWLGVLPQAELKGALMMGYFVWVAAYVLISLGLVLRAAQLEEVGHPSREAA